MDIEFHYYVTYLTATRAGFKPKDANILAYSSQYVDNNDILFEINKDSEELYYENYISQTLDITKPQKDLLRIYPFFHFIPGEESSYSEKINEDEMPSLNTIPDNVNANKMIDKSLAGNNLYEIGIACHAYLDTWSHQNFVGMENDYNSLGHILPNIGHADAGHDPDIPDKVWDDTRLKNATVNNKERFLVAIGRLFEKLFKYQNGDGKLSKLSSEKQDLIDDIEEIIEEGSDKEERIGLYKELALKDEYGRQEIENYDEYYWFNEAIKEDYPEKYDIDVKLTINLKHLFFEDYTWDDPDNYNETHWFKFQEAVKFHQNRMEGILSSNLEFVSTEKW